jgi:multisubunit Na+/H+ antiporter MnhG subunit
VSELVQAALLWLGVAAELACCLGVLVMGDAFGRLHYLSAAGTVGPVLIVAAIVVGHGLDPVGLKALVVALVLGVSGPILTHAIARMTRVRRDGRFEIRDEERVA